MVQLPIYRVKQRHLEAYLARSTGWTTSTSCWRPGPRRACARNTSSARRCRQPANAQEADRIRRGHRTRNVALILNVLCIDGYIPAGQYIIDTHPEPPPGQVYRALLIETGDPNDPRCVAFKREHRHSTRLHNWLYRWTRRCWSRKARNDRATHPLRPACLLGRQSASPSATHPRHDRTFTRLGGGDVASTSRSCGRGHRPLRDGRLKRLSLAMLSDSRHWPSPTRP